MASGPPIFHRALHTAGATVFSGSVFCGGTEGCQGVGASPRSSVPEGPRMRIQSAS